MTNAQAISVNERYRQWFHRLIVPALLVLVALLAITSLIGDSITYDETSKLTAGMSYLKTGDFRLGADHPPLGKIWVAWPLLFVENTWPPSDTPGWRKADVFLTGRTWLFELNDGQRLMVIARCMMVIQLLGLCGTIYGLGRRLFGPSAGLLALLLAGLSPTLLAHGRLVTTDVPITLFIALTLLTFARLMDRVTWWRVLATAAALGAAAVSKLSWPLVLPALAVMGLMAILKRQPIKIATHRRGRMPQRWLAKRRERTAAVVVIVVLLAVTTYVSIWSCYAWRTSIFSGPSAADVDPSVTPAAEQIASHWNRALHDEKGQPRTDLIAGIVRWAAAWHLLPDAYLYGLAWTLESTGDRSAYFCGETSSRGWRWYFPLALAIKTPVATLVLFIAGIIALIRRKRRHCADPVLLAGLATYVAVHLVQSIISNFNIGHRHLLPIYPAIFVLAGASSLWLDKRLGRWLIGGAIVWLAATNLWIHPHYLSYFNEFVGGPSKGHLYLADSNIDWGQDLKRLSHYAAEHPDDRIKLSYFGSAVPTAYGFDCRLLPSSIETGSAEHLDGGGLYVISVTHLLGVYDTFAQDAFWQDPQRQQQYLQLHTLIETQPAGDNDDIRRKRELARNQYAHLRWGRFLCNLRRRPPDERIGYSLFLYHLNQSEINKLTRPGETYQRYLVE